MMRWWCSVDARMMPSWCPHYALMMRSWCAHDAMMILLWCADGALMMPWWCCDNAPMMHWWCTDDALMMHWRFTGYDMMHRGQFSDLHWRFYLGRINGNKTWQPTTTTMTDRVNIEISAWGRLEGRVLQYIADYIQHQQGHEKRIIIESQASWSLQGSLWWEIVWGNYFFSLKISRVNCQQDQE